MDAKGIFVFVLPTMIAAGLAIVMGFGGNCIANSHDIQIEKKIVEYIASGGKQAVETDRRCGYEDKYRICLIDNFGQKFNITPEVRTSHGEMLAKLLRSGRSDLEIKILNTSLSKGLALVIDELLAGGCFDAVVSSTPGSNYTYDQIGSLFSGREEINSENILSHRESLKKLMTEIALRGFPSVEWYQNIDVNSIKLRNDARKVVFIETLGRFQVPVVLPYGNADSTYRGKIKNVNLLSLASNAKTFSALDRQGNRIPGFPYSPLSTGEEQGIYDVVECPHPDDPHKACLDINEDGHCEYMFARTGKIDYFDEANKVSFAPPLLSPKKFAKLLSKINIRESCRMDEEIVLTAEQYRELAGVCPATTRTEIQMAYVWLNSPKHGRFFEFEARCRKRGKIEGASLIPPNKIKELLPPKAHEKRQSRETFSGGGQAEKIEN